ncbi:two pore calcium channel protein 1-like isoform X1 [Dreissena polymorpha]|uniref:EF-hand domain-containing protein n=1 Tax=Dreissena polymorpha TaxID=45954 RepID=A0A9D4R279_DREPO|nr:two pore calcium channel protein 1-like isoform X1 [Dreissena polymorpha]KAH3852239.1 hypothetical protein DPMN_094740 [Dreissena polymorpha]
MSESGNHLDNPVIVIDGVEDDQIIPNKAAKEKIDTGQDSQTIEITSEIPVAKSHLIKPPPNVSPRVKRENQNVSKPETVTLSIPTEKQQPSNAPTSATKSSNGEPSERRRRHSSRDEDLKHLTEEKLILAQTLIEDAESGRNFTYKTDPNYVRYYILYHQWYFRLALYICILLNMSLALFEKPTRPDWAVPYWGSMIMEAFCIAFFIVRVIHLSYFSQPNIFWRDTKNLMVIAIIALTIIDMICYIAWVNAAPDTNPVRWSRPLRALLIINFSDGRQIRRAFRNIRRTVPEIMNVFILFLMGVLLFALLALKLFGRRKSLKYPDGEPYFKTYFDSVWDLYVLVTTANNPDVMMPAYDESNWFALFFMAYLIICLYVFMSIVLAVIYNNYKENMKNEIRDSVFGKRRKLRQAFSILKIQRNGEDIITRHIWETIMAKVLPTKSIQQIDLLMTILDKDGTGYISKSDFLNLINLLQVPVSEVMDRQTFLEKKIPDIYNSKISRFIRICVRHKFFRIFFDVAIFVNAWFIGFDLDVADWFFLAIFMIEIVLKLYVFGPKEFFRRLWNIFDFLVIFGAVIATCVESVVGEVGEELSTLDLLLVLRVMRLVKILISIKRFKLIIVTIYNIGPSILTYGGVIFVLYYMFAIVGMEIFHGLVQFYGYNESDPSQMFCGNPKLNGTAFYYNHYCNNNFNDILHSIVVLFELTVVNQWHVISSGFIFVTNKWARLYFLSFHMSCVIIVLNIFVAFILEAFILEYNLQRSGKFESAVESKIKELGIGIGQQANTGANIGPPEVDKLELVNNEAQVDKSPQMSRRNSTADIEANDESGSETDSIPDLSNEKGVRFHLKKKSRKTVEVLLQQMFEGEINPEDDGDENSYNLRQRKWTLEAVA